MKKPLIVANWKMNPLTFKKAEELFKGINKEFKKAEVVICPPFIYLSSSKTKFSLGAQNCSWEKEGAFSGEISPYQLKSIGCKYVILGHSERRKYFNETNEIIGRKIKKGLEAGLKPILCIGEALKEKNHIADVLKKQIKQSLKGVSQKDAEKISIAYEPVWAIGSGSSCPIEQAKSTALLIRKILSELYNARKIRILYGGSVNSKNASLYIEKAGMDGLLIGGASLNPKEFLKIIKNISKLYSI